MPGNDDMSTWNDLLSFTSGSHNSVRICIPPPPLSSDNDLQEVSKDDLDPFQNDGFRQRLASTITACREMGKSSLWIEVPMKRASLIECMNDFGIQFHHAEGTKAVLNLWLLDTVASKIPTYATHNVGVGGFVVNSRNELLCVRELRNNYRPWKTPTGLSELGEQIPHAAEREVLEETGIRTKFHSIIAFRQTHGLTHGRSDMFFVCRLDPIEGGDENGNPIIPEPVAQQCEIAEARWVPLDEYKAMVHDPENGHPMMSHVLDVFEAGRRIESRIVESVVPGRKPNAIYYPVS